MSIPLIKASFIFITRSTVSCLLRNIPKLLYVLQSPLVSSAAYTCQSLQFYLVMFIVYAVLGGAWGFLCYKHMSELLPLQVGYSNHSTRRLPLTTLSVLSLWARWLPDHRNARQSRSAPTLSCSSRVSKSYNLSQLTTATLTRMERTLFRPSSSLWSLFLDAGRNSLSFFMLLVVSLGLSVVRDSLGSTMRKCQLLAGAHFIFGGLFYHRILMLNSRVLIDTPCSSLRSGHRRTRI